MSVCNTCALEKECMLKYDVSARMFCNSYAEKKPLTNADRIRTMTDEELADYILKRDIEIVDRLSQLQAFIYNFDKEKGKKDLLNWLKQEVDNE